MTASGSDMRSVGISPGGIEGDLEIGDNIESDLADADITEPEVGGDTETPPAT